ncbi:MAG: sel1 repeat family protein [Dysgonamonadaceae bacterium]|jgi:TPR repeat protein|nr:sel1 repeat family protein [Dysgonamonadaceae bacterium]
MRKYVCILLLFGSAIAVHCQNAEKYLVELRECFNKGNYECAKTRYEAWVVLSGKTDVDEINKINKCLEIKSTADKYYKNKAYEKACIAYKNLLEMNPNDKYAEQQIKKCCVVPTDTVKSLLSIDPLQSGREYYREKNYSEAKRYFEKSAKQGNAIGQNNLGLMYENGYGVIKDYNEAVRWYRESAEQGFAIAQYNLGLMYEYGYGVKKNQEEAVKWFKESAKQGNQEAIAILKQIKL